MRRIDKLYLEFPFAAVGCCMPAPDLFDQTWKRLARRQCFSPVSTLPVPPQLPFPSGPVLHETYSNPSNPSSYEAAGSTSYSGLPSPGAPWGWVRGPRSCGKVTLNNF